MRKNIFFLYVLTLILVFVSIVAWEFFLEPAALTNTFIDYTSESLVEKWKNIKTVFVFCAIALIFPALLALKIEKQRRTAHDSLAELQKETARLLKDRTVELAVARTELSSEKLRRSLSESSGETTNISLQTLIDSINDSLMVIDNNYRVRMLNRTAGEIYFNGPRMLDEPLLCYKLSHNQDSPCSGSDHECPFDSVRKTGVAQTVLHYHFDSKGNKTPYEIQASPIFNDSGDVIGIVELARDVSGRIEKENRQRTADERLLNLQREQSIASMAGGLAHEFNNILTSILGNAELLSVRLAETDENKKQTEAIISGSEHLGLLTKQLLAFTRNGKYLYQSFNINDQIENTLHLIYTDEFATYDVEIEQADDIWPVLGDPAQINQLLMNLIVNGFEALHGTDGKLIIRTANETMGDELDCQLQDTLPPGDYIHLSITNTGSTLPDDLIGKIFDPFFSTKLSGRGMGLAAAKGIVRNHHGCISVKNGPDRTTFDVYLPRDNPEDEQTGKAGADISGFAGLKVLVVDDEPQVLSIITNLLNHHKCTVLTAGKGMEALEIIKRHKDKLNLVILDIQMPDMSGDKVYTELKKVKPGLRVLITSGHAEHIALKDIVLEPSDKFIKKPFRMSNLMLSIKELLAGG